MKINILVLLNFLFLQCVYAQVILKDFKGMVYAIDNYGKRVDLKKGDVIERGYTVFTSSSSEAEIMLDKNIGIVILYENTKLLLETTTENKSISFIESFFGIKNLNANEENENIIDYLYGKAVFVFKNLGKLKYNVKTIHAVCGVRGTSFIINSNDKVSEIGVYRGEVEISKNDKKKIIKRNQTAYIYNTDIKIENRLSKIAEKEKNRALKIEKYFENLRKKIEKRNEKINQRLSKD